MAKFTIKLTVVDMQFIKTFFGTVQSLSYLIIDMTS